MNQFRKLDVQTKEAFGGHQREGEEHPNWEEKPLSPESGQADKSLAYGGCVSKASVARQH